jgi:ferredoxin
MLRKIIQIDEEKCTGCGLCIPNCHEGALQIIDGKARLISDLFCDGLGACLGYCPEGAIEIVEREAKAYSETLVMEQMAKQGRNTILAHLEHLRDHKEYDLLKEAVVYIKEHNIDLSPSSQTTQINHSMINFPNSDQANEEAKQSSVCGCAGSKTMDFRIDQEKVNAAISSAPALSELHQWPVQLHLLNPQASYFKNADVVLAADCAAFAMGDFHQKFLKNKTLAIACPKLDTNKESYVEKITSMVRDANINTLTVVMMEVPCCGGLLQMAKIAVQHSGRNIPLKKAIIGVQGEVLTEEWV